MQMEIGELKHRITLRKSVTMVNTIGFEETSWQDVKTLWAAVANLSGREYFAAAAVQAENTVKFTIRYTPDIETTMRIFFQDKQYNITAIDNIKYQSKYLEIKALEVMSGE